MGSMINLSVGGLEIDWGKNHYFTDHGDLFQTMDVKKIPYYYVSDDEDRKIITEYKDGLSKPLWQVLDRINLTGHTFSYAEKEFVLQSYMNYVDLNKFTFENFIAVLGETNLEDISRDYGDGGHSFGKFFKREIFPKLGFKNIVDDLDYIEWEIGEAMENLGAKIVLQSIGLHKKFNDLPVEWAFKYLRKIG